MCGIIGVITNTDTNVSPTLIEGLKRLEYRGYDSAGIATLSHEGKILCRRSKGKLINLEDEIQRNPISGNIGIGHTRWATHGQPTRKNAHPHRTDRVAVVHNGIIENFRELRTKLEKDGRVMNSETDSEVIPHFITQFLENGMTPFEAVDNTLSLLSGTFALAILFAKEQFLIAAKRGSPLAIGYGEGKMYIGSDAIALSPFTSRISYLKDGDIAHVKDNDVTIRNGDSNVIRPIQLSLHSSATVGKGSYKHYMMREIYEQPDMLAATLRQYVEPIKKTISLPEFPFCLNAIQHISIVACGTSNYAGMVSKYWIEKLSGLPVTVDIASEFRYRNTPLRKGGLSLFISQSGETADTLAALQFARERKQHIISLVNVMESTMALESDVVLSTLAGAEIGVASTKAFTTQLMSLLCLALAFADARNALTEKERNEITEALTTLPNLVMDVLGLENTIRMLVQEIVNSNSVLFIGRGTSYPIALEGALKLKELTYIHAEGVAAGELKHGPLALIDKLMRVIAIVPSDALFEKTCSNIYEVSARGGKVIALCDAKGEAVLKEIASHIIVMPESHPLLSPILYTIPLQLLAYHVAVARGHDVDQPRNLAKSVTVE